MPRVLHVVQSGDRGGVQRHVHDLALGLPQDTAGVVSGSEGWLLESVREAGIPGHTVGHLQRSLDPRAVAKARRELASECADLGPDVIHAHGVFALLAVLPLAERMPLVYTGHGFQWHDASHRWSLRQASLRLHRQAARRVTAFVAVASEADEARRVGFRWVEEIPNGVPLAEEGARRADSNTFGVATRLVQGKGLIELLGVLAAEPGLRLKIAGDGPLQREIEEEAVRKGVRARLELLGWQQDLGAFYESLFAYVSLSRKEGLPYGVLDAMASGLPLVLSDIPGHRELVDAGRNGDLVPVGDVRAAAKALRRLQQDPRRRRAAGYESREIVSERFSLGTMLVRHHGLYGRVGVAER